MDCNHKEHLLTYITYNTHINIRKHTHTYKPTIGTKWREIDTLTAVEPIVNPKEKGDVQFDGKLIA